MAVFSKSNRLSRRAAAGLGQACVLAAALLLNVAGCTKAPEPTFTHLEKTKELIPEVRDGVTFTPEGEEESKHVPGVTEVVHDRFGTLADPKVWPILPVDFGGTPAAVVSAQAAEAGDAKQGSSTAAESSAGEDSAVDRVEVVFEAAGEESLGDLPIGSQVAWTGGAYEGKTHRLVAYDAQAKKGTLEGEFEEGPPEEGDECLLNPGTKLAAGKVLYERHCMHCHGADGAGDGPTAKYLYPLPRDYRRGTFKFTSTDRSSKISRDDLLEVLHRGIPGTSMPAFRLLSDADLNLLVEYVRWLSMRGEYELQLANLGATAYTRDLVEERLKEGETREEIMEELHEFMEYDFTEETEFAADNLAEAWSEANDESAVVTPGKSRVPDTLESRLRGRALYISEKTKCATCHGVYGKGDGSQATAYQLIPGTSDTYPLPGLYDDWTNPIRPRDLTQGVYRGGRRPIDLYRRIHAGIKGTPMPGFGGTLTDEEIWDLVNYVLHVPFDPLPKAGAGQPLANVGH